MIFTTLNTIIEDLLKVIRGGILNSTEPISKRQLENWVHQYRAELIRQDLNKGYYPNPDYIQEITALKLDVFAGGDFLPTFKEVPKTINTRYKSGITWIGDADKNEYNLVPVSRAVWQQHKRYSATEPIVYLEGKKFHVSNTPGISSLLTVKGIFENPMEVIRFQNPTVSMQGLDFPYPIPSDKVTTLKEMILSKELKIEISAPIDITNDDKHNPKPTN